MRKSSFEKLDEPFSKDADPGLPKTKPEKLLPDFDLDEPFAEDTGLESSASNLNDAEWQVTSEALARQAEIRKQIERIRLKALMFDSEAESGQNLEELSSEEESEAQIEKDRKSALLKLATGIMTNESPEYLKASMADYIKNLPQNKYILASLFRSIFEQKLQDIVDPFVVDLMAEDKLPDLYMMEQVDQKIFGYLDKEIEKRRVKRSGNANDPFFTLTGTDE